MLRYTPEQADVLDHMIENEGILLVQAGAGTGKSFMAKQVASELKPRNGLYTAFNKAIVQEGVDRFYGTNMECKTLHALAYKYVNSRRNISDFTYTCITENLTYGAKYQIINAMDMFYVSASADMYEFYDDFFSDAPDKGMLVEITEKYTEMMIAGELDPTFNYLLKCFHLMLLQGTVKCEYDLVILDEINDTTAVALEIFRLIKAPKKLGLGETNQAIYKFLNLVNGFEVLKDEPQLRLTQSWRCSTGIAARIQKMMRKDVDPEFTFKGTDNPVRNGKTLYCTSTNASIVFEINYRLRNRKGFTLLRNISEIFAAPLALTTAATGKKPFQKKYAFLADEYENYIKERKPGQTYMAYLAANVDDKEIQNVVNLLLRFSREGINIFDVYKKAKEAKPDPDYTIATVFTSKGLEYEDVYIADDLNKAIDDIREKGGIENDDDLVQYRCYYVACSRAGANLHNTKALYV